MCGSSGGGGKSRNKFTVVCASGIHDEENTSIGLVVCLSSRFPVVAPASLTQLGSREPDVNQRSSMLLFVPGNKFVL